MKKQFSDPVAKIHQQFDDEEHAKELEESMKPKRVFIIPCDYAGHTVAYDLTNDDQARKILRDAVREFESMGHIFEDIEEHIENLNWGEIGFQLQETGLCNNRDGFIIEIKDEWVRGQF
jgi:hypothetical protein